MKFTKNIIKKKKKLFSKLFSKDFYRKKKFAEFFTLQENFPIRAKMLSRLVKNCHGPRKSQFFATLPSFLFEEEKKCENYFDKFSLILKNQKILKKLIELAVIQLLQKCLI